MRESVVQILPYGFNYNFTTVEIIHFDTAGRFAASSIGGAVYFVLIKDEGFRFMYLGFLKNKNEAVEHA